MLAPLVAALLAGCASAPSCEQRLEDLLRTQHPVLSPLAHYPKRCSSGHCAYAAEQPEPEPPQMSSPAVACDEGSQVPLEDSLLLFAGDSCPLSSPALARLALAQQACGSALPQARIVLKGTPAEAKRYLANAGANAQVCLDNEGAIEKALGVRSYPSLHAVRNGEYFTVEDPGSLLRQKARAKSYSCSEAMRSLLGFDDPLDSAFSANRKWNLGCLDSAGELARCYDSSLDGKTAPQVRHAKEVSSSRPRRARRQVLAFIDDSYGGKNETIAVLMERAYHACPHISFLAVFPPEPSREYTLTQRFYDVGGYSYPAATDIPSEEQDPVWRGALGKTFLGYGLRGGAHPTVFVIEKGKVLGKETVRNLKF